MRTGILCAINRLSFPIHAIAIGSQKSKGMWPGDPGNHHNVATQSANPFSETSAPSYQNQHRSRTLWKTAAVLKHYYASLQMLNRLKLVVSNKAVRRQFLFDIHSPPEVIKCLSLRIQNRLKARLTLTVRSLIPSRQSLLSLTLFFLKKVCLSLIRRN